MLNFKTSPASQVLASSAIASLPPLPQVARLYLQRKLFYCSYEGRLASRIQGDALYKVSGVRPTISSV